MEKPITWPYSKLIGGKMEIIDRITRADNAGEIVKTGNRVYQIDSFGQKF